MAEKTFHFYFVSNVSPVEIKFTHPSHFQYQKENWHYFMQTPEHLHVVRLGNVVDHHLELGELAGNQRNVLDCCRVALQVERKPMVFQDSKPSVNVRACEEVVSLEVDEVTNPDKLGPTLLAELGNGNLHHLVLGQVKPSHYTFQESMLFCLRETPFNAFTKMKEFCGCDQYCS